MVEYKQEKENEDSNALSQKMGNLSAITMPSSSLLEQLKDRYIHDPRLQSLLQHMEQSNLDQPHYSLKSGILFYKDRLYIGASNDLRNQVLQLPHNNP